MAAPRSPLLLAAPSSPLLLAALTVLGCAVAGVVPPSPPERVCNVLAHGARGDNRTEDTSAVVGAIAACAPGGTVLLPAGYIFLLRPVRLPSNLTLRIDGTIAAWPDVATWPNSTVRECSTSPYETPEPQIVTAPQREALLWAVNASNIRITGSGTIDGGGWRWWPLRNRPGNYWHNCRPSLLSFGRRWPRGWWGVRDTVVEGITLKDSPFWTIQGRGLQGVVFDNVRVYTTGCGYAQAPNTDGFNIQGQDILIQNCRVRNGDDCVPIFPPTRNVTVRNITCECGNGVAPIVWPSLSIPGEGGDLSDILFEDATFTGTAYAVGVKPLPSFVGQIRNVTYRRFRLSGVKQAVMINVFNQQQVAVAGSGEGRHNVASRLGTSTITGAVIEDISGTVYSPGKLTCAAGPLKCTDFAMRNVSLAVVGGGSAAYECENVLGSQEDCQPRPCGW